MAVRVRPATLADLPALRQLWTALYQETATDYPAHRAEDADDATRILAHGLSDPQSTFVCMVAEPVEPAAPGGWPVGFIAGEPVRRVLGHPTDFLLVHWLYVVPEMRGQRIAAQLIVALSEAAEQRGCVMIEFFASYSNPAYKRIPIAKPHAIVYHAPTDAVRAWYADASKRRRRVALAASAR